MIRVSRSGHYLLVALACFGGFACQLRRPHTMPSRMIEPQLLDSGIVRTTEASNEGSQRRLRPPARYPSTRTHRAPCAAPATKW